MDTIEKAKNLLLEGLEKARKMPIGTISSSGKYKKVAEGKWVPVDKNKRRKEDIKEDITDKYPQNFLKEFGDKFLEIKKDNFNNIKKELNKKNIKLNIFLNKVIDDRKFFDKIGFTVYESDYDDKLHAEVR